MTERGERTGQMKREFIITWHPLFMTKKQGRGLATTLHCCRAADVLTIWYLLLILAARVYLGSTVLPQFSWDTLPVYFHSSSRTGQYNDEALIFT